MIELHATLEIRQLHACAVREDGGGPEGVLTTGHGRAQNRGMSTLPMRLLLVVVFSGLFLALAVAARGGIGAFFSRPALIGLTVVLIALCAAALAAGGNLSPGVREDTSNRWVIAVFGVITLLLVFLPPWSDRKGIWIIDGDAIRWLGVAFRSGIGVLLAALLVPPLLARIKAEERLLQSQFGAEYDAYRARTLRLIPGLY